jgi:nitric oxide reductase activation protein
MNIQEELTAFEIFQTLFDFCILLAFVLCVTFLLKGLKSVLGDGQAEEVTGVQAVSPGQTPPPTYSESWINPYWWNQEAAPEQEEDQEDRPRSGLSSSDEINIEIHSAPRGVVVDDAERCRELCHDAEGYDTVDV